MSDDPFAPLDAWLLRELRALSPESLRPLFGDIGQDLRRRHQARIAAQTGPDGEAWAARKFRKPRPGQVRKKQAMLLGLREARRLKLKVSAAGIELGYSGSDGRIATIHQHGLVDAVTKGGPRVKYPARPLLGLSADDIAAVKSRLFQALDRASRS